MKKIPLTKGYETIVDDEDFEWLSKFKWYASTNSEGRIDARRALKNKKSILMQKQILQVPNSFRIDHVNHNTLDNRRKNLRIATPSQNNMNSRKYKNNSSGYMGVSWFKPRGKWRVRIDFNHKQLCLGYYDDLITAAKIYDKAAKKYHGEFATLNFP